MFANPTAWAQDETELTSLQWTQKIIDILPPISSITPEASIKIQDYKNADLRTLRHAMQDVQDYTISIDRAELLELYTQRAREQDARRDLKLAELYKIIRRESRLNNVDDLIPFELDPDWFIACMAHIEKAYHYNAIDPTLATNEIKKAILTLPVHASAEDIIEARYNLINVIQTLSIFLGDIDAAYASTKQGIELAANQNRITDRSTMVLNLAQIHAKTFDSKHSSLITNELIKYSQALPASKKPIILGVHGRLLILSGQHDAAIPFLLEALEHKPDNFWELVIMALLADAYIESNQIEKAAHFLERTKVMRADLKARSPRESSINSIEAKLERALGNYQRADELQQSISQDIEKRYNDSKLNTKLNIDFDITITQSDSKKVYPQTDALDIHKFLPEWSETDTSLSSALPVDLSRKLKELQIELELYEPSSSGYGTQLHDLRQKFMDAVFERITFSPEEILSEYRLSLNSSNPEEVEFLRLFEAFVRVQNEKSSDKKNDLTSDYEGVNRDELLAYSYLLQAVLALKQNDMPEMYLNAARARQLSEIRERFLADFQYEFSELELLISAIEGNPKQALNSAQTHIKSGQIANRNDFMTAALNNTVIAFERSGQAEQALSLADEFMKVTRLRDGEPSFNALYTKGRLLNSTSKFSEAILFLETARDKLPNQKQEALILRQLFIGYAATGKITKAESVKKELLLLLNKHNNPKLINSTAPLIAQGDYFLAKFTSNENVADTKQAWKDSELGYFNSLSRYQIQLANIRTEANLQATREWSNLISSEINDANQKLSRQRLFLMGSAIVVLLVLATMLIFWRNSRRAKLSVLKHIRASQVKGQFLNLIGHEARVNLQGIDSFVKSLKSSSISMEHLPTVQVIGLQAGTLMGAISDLIFSARIISGDRSVTDEVFTPLKYRERILPVWQELIGSRDVVISLNVSPKLTPLMVDTFFLENAINQIVNIAIEKTRVGEITIELSEELSLRSMRLNVSIEDTGSGIPSDELETLFDFFEVDENGISKVSHNLSLGYPIAKNAIQALGGVIRIDSQPGRGTRVSFSIPVKRAAANDLTPDA